MDPDRRRFRWLTPLVAAIVGVVALVVVRRIEVWRFEQQRSYAVMGIIACTTVLLLLWWLLRSPVSWRVRLIGLVLVGLLTVPFRIRGVTGDFVPIIEYRFAKKKAAITGGGTVDANVVRPAYPQLFGPNRDARLSGPVLDPDWSGKPPQLIWKQPIGAAWSGFSVVGNRAVTQEQDGESECVSCYEVTTGKQLWRTPNPGRYGSETGVAGLGPRATPTIVGDRVYALGALGAVRCLELATGKPLWTRNMVADAGGAHVPEWGFASSPLVHDGKVMVSAGGAKSLIAYRADDGEITWIGGSRPVNYSSPFLVTLVGRPQIVMLNTDALTAHDPGSGKVLWEYIWGKKAPNVSRPIPIGDRRLFLSSGYGVGSALIELSELGDGQLRAEQVWRTIRYQAKFSNPAERDGYLYGVSDGIFACLDVRDGTVKWKDGRYGHGQGLLVGEFYLQMTEQPGELVLLRPTPDGANELGRFPVFEAKTWNPITLTGDLLLVRNDQEAACIRLPVKAVP